MDFRAAIVVHLCLLVAPEACRAAPHGSKALNMTIQRLRTTDLRPVLGNLSSIEPFKNDTCQHLHGTGLGDPEEVRISSFTCYILKVSKQAPELYSGLAETLQRISQQLDSMQPGPARHDCVLPELKEHYVWVRCVWCLLQRLDRSLDERLHNATL